jgi:hypothetical protein
MLLYVTVNPRTILGCTTMKNYAPLRAHTSTIQSLRSGSAAIHTLSRIWYSVNPVDSATSKAMSYEIPGIDSTCLHVKDKIFVK